MAHISYMVFIDNEPLYPRNQAWHVSLRMMIQMFGKKMLEI